jgi:quercetin dioxygenase-like cupin family protein
MTQRVRHVRAGEGRAFWMAGDTYTLKATAESTGGSLALLEASVPPGCGPPLHTHASEDEAFYMIAGTLEISAGADTILVRPGDFVFMPRETPHRFKNTGVDAARALILFAPAGFERFFQDAGAAARPGEQAPATEHEHLARVAEIASRHGVHIHTPEEVI